MDTNIPTDVDTINNCLPQTQCRLCGYPDCLSYARAITRGERLNLCHPGGERSLAALEKACNRNAESRTTEYISHTVIIDERSCIGCYKCVIACPVSAIVGAAKKMHTVMSSDCTGCDLCIPVCPVDCISLRNSYNLCKSYSNKAITQIWQGRKKIYDHKNRPKKKISISTEITQNTVQQQQLGRKNYQITLVKKAMETCRKRGHSSQMAKLERQLMTLQSESIR